MPLRTCRASTSRWTQVRKARLSLALDTPVSVAAVLAVVSTLHDRFSPADSTDFCFFFFFAASFASASRIAFAISFLGPSCQASTASLQYQCAGFELAIILNHLRGSPHPGL